MTIVEQAVRSPSDVGLEAASALAAGEVVVAARAVRALLAARPHDYMARKLSARLAGAYGRKDTAATTARFLLKLDPLDVDLHVLLFETSTNAAEQAAALQEAYELEPSLVIEERVRRASGNTLPPIAQRWIARILRRARLHDLAASRFALSSDTLLEEVIERAWLGEFDQTLPALAELSEKGAEMPLVARALHVHAQMREGRPEAAQALLLGLFAFDPSLSQVKRYLPEHLFESFPLVQTNDAYTVETQENEVRLIPWRPAEEVNGVVSEAPVVITTPVFETEEKETISEVRVEPTRSVAESLAAHVASVPGVRRALVVNREGKVMANAPVTGLDNLQARLLSIFIAQAWTLDQTFSLVKPPVEDLRLRSAGTVLYAFFSVIPDGSLCFIADSNFDPTLVRQAITQALSLQAGGA